MINKKNNYIYNYLKELFPEADCELNFTNPFELLVAVVLSAQCTDKRVNLVTPNLFKRYPTPQAMANASQNELEQLIYSTGFYRNKAKNLINASKSIVENFNSQVPSELEKLKTLAGVGRKTANVVYSVAFNGQAIAVDTHVFRVSNRLGITNAKKELDVELSLMQQFDKNIWSDLHYRLVLFGRYYCKAKNPECSTCKLKNICVYYNKQIKNKEV